MEEITEENSSVEHVILNSMGGWLKSDKLLCKGCNSKFGHDIDNELAQQFAFLSGYLKVKRDKGSIPVLKGGKLSDGTGIHLVNGSTPRLANPKFEVTSTEEGLEYNIVARDRQEMKKMLQGLKKKHPSFNVDEALAMAQTKVERLKEHVHYRQTYGGELAFRSIAKSAVSFFLLNKGKREFIQPLIPYLKGEGKLDVVKHYQPAKFPYQREANEIIHLLHIVGDKHKKLLYCYVEFFSSHSYLVLLSKDYTGKNLKATYAYNIRTNQIVKKDVKLKLSESEIDSLPSTFECFGVIQEKMKRIMGIAHEMHTLDEMKNINRRAIEDIFEKKYGHEKFITPQMTAELSQRLANDIVEFFYGNFEDTA